MPVIYFREYGNNSRDTLREYPIAHLEILSVASLVCRDKFQKTYLDIDKIPVTYLKNEDISGLKKMMGKKKQ